MKLSVSRFHSNGVRSDGAAVRRSSLASGAWESCRPLFDRPFLARPQPQACTQMPLIRTCVACGTSGECTVRCGGHKYGRRAVIAVLAPAQSQRRSLRITVRPSSLVTVVVTVRQCSRGPIRTPPGPTPIVTSFRSR